jgi:hypothetical protein
MFVNRLRAHSAAVEDGQVAGFAILIARPGYLLLEDPAGGADDRAASALSGC